MEILSQLSSRLRESKEIEQIYLDCSAFAMVFHRVNYVDATVLHMPLLTNGTSFNINNYEPWNKKFLSLTREFMFELKLHKSSIINPPWSNFPKKIKVKIGRFDLKNHFYIL